MQTSFIRWLRIVLVFSFLLPVTGWTQTASADEDFPDGVIEDNQMFLPLIKKNSIADMVHIPAGTFQMGCEPAHNGGYSSYSWELPVHTVNQNAYYIDRYEVSNAQYARCVVAGSCATPMDIHPPPGLRTISTPPAPTAR